MSSKQFFVPSFRASISRATPHGVKWENITYILPWVPEAFHARFRFRSSPVKQIVNLVP